MNPSFNKGELTGTVQLFEAPERRPPWKLIGALVVVILLGVGFWWLRPREPENPRQHAQELRETDLPGALEYAEEQLKGAEEKSDVRFWREFLAENYAKAKKNDKARVHYAWLVKNYPKEAKYKKALAKLAPAKPGKPPKKKKGHGK